MEETLYDTPLSTKSKQTTSVPQEDPIPGAFQIIYTVLKGLDNETKLKVVKSVLTSLGVELKNEKTPPVGYEGAENVVEYTSQKFSDDRNPSPKEFLFEKNPTTDIERVVCLAYYLTHYRNTRHFKTLEISKLNTEAAQIKFANAAVAVDNATKKGFLVPASKGDKQISSMGELYVLALPNKEDAKKILTTKGKKRKSKKTISSSRNGMPPI